MGLILKRTVLYLLEECSFFNIKKEKKGENQMSKGKKMNLHQKLLEIRRSVPYLQKTNKGHQYSYVSSSDVIGAVREKMDSLGVLLTPRITDTKMSVLKINNRDVIQTELFIDFVWRCVESGEELVVPFYAQGTDPHEKGVGKALTYAEKYLLLKQFNIPTDSDDPDYFQQRFDNAPAFITSEQVAELKQMTDELAGLREVPSSNFMNMLGVNSFERLTVDQFYHIRGRLNNWLNQAKNKKGNENIPKTTPKASADHTENNQNNHDGIKQDQIAQLEAIIDEIAKVSKVDPSKIVGVLGKPLNEIKANQFEGAKSQLKQLLQKAQDKSTNNQKPQDTNQPKSNQETKEEVKNSKSHELTLKGKENIKTPSGKEVVKFHVKELNDEIYARTKETINVISKVNEGETFSADLVESNGFLFVASITNGNVNQTA